jgi:hypothetical protein
MTRVSCDNSHWQIFREFPSRRVPFDDSTRPDQDTPTSVISGANSLDAVRVSSTHVRALNTRSDPKVSSHLCHPFNRKPLRELRDERPNGRHLAHDPSVVTGPQNASLSVVAPLPSIRTRQD